MTFFLARPVALAALAGLGLLLLAFAVGPAPAADVKEGQPAPDIDLPATQIDKVLPGAKSLKLKDLQGKKHVVLYFYPKALTGG
jgi:hypothetical protein